MPTFAPAPVRPAHFGITSVPVPADALPVGGTLAATDRPKATEPLWDTPRRRDPRPGLKPLFERAKQAVRLARHRQQLHELADRLADRPAWLQVARQHPSLFHPLLTRYLDRRLSADARLAWMSATFDGAEDLCGPEGLACIAAGEPLTLMRLAHPDGGDWTLRLGLNPVNWHEGLLAITLHDPQGLRVMNLSFGFMPDDGRGRALYIGSLQGAGGDHPDTAAAIRQATRIAHGLRPPALLMAALRALAQAAGVATLVGVDPDHHLHGQWNRRHRLRFDYRAFWQACGGHRGPDRRWHLPVDPPRRALTSIASAKRAMYRRRFTLLDDLGREAGALVAAGRPTGTGVGTGAAG